MHIVHAMPVVSQEHINALNKEILRTEKQIDFMKSRMTREQLQTGNAMVEKIMRRGNRLPPIQRQT